MPGNLLSTQATVQCMHLGQVTTGPGSARVKILGVPVATMTDASAVAACPFAPGGNPHPCTSLSWAAPATRVLIDGVPPLLQTSVGTCVAADQARQGVARITVNQTRVTGI